MSKARALAVLLFASFVLAGCQDLLQTAVGSSATPAVEATETALSTATPIRAASPSPTFTPPPPPTLIPIAPPPTSLPVKCQDDLELVLELSIAPGSDGSLPVLPPGSMIEKGWRVRNSGDCSWDSAYSLVPQASNPDWAKDGQFVPVSGEVKPGGLYDFWIETTAPLTPGGYQAGWELHDSRGVVIEPPLTLDFEIAFSATETPQPEVSLVASPVEILRGEKATISWSTHEAKAAYFYPASQAWWQHPVDTSGVTVVKPERTTTYELRAVMGDDTVEIRRITIEIKPFEAPKIVYFRLKPGNVIDQGQCVDLFWRVNGRVNTIKVFRNDNFFVESTNEVGSTWDCPVHSGFYTYTLQAVGPGGTTEMEHKLEMR